eukprot:5187014-Prymnesium_polylepis.1
MSLDAVLIPLGPWNRQRRQVRLRLNGEELGAGALAHRRRLRDGVVQIHPGLEAQDLGHVAAQPDGRPLPGGVWRLLWMACMRCGLGGDAGPVAVLRLPVSYNEVVEATHVEPEGRWSRADVVRIVVQHGPGRKWRRATRARPLSSQNGPGDETESGFTPLSFRSCFNTLKY